VAEASLTGESEPVLKATAVLADPAPLGDRVNMVCSGTAVTRGRGRAVVTTTGIHTEMGRIASLLGRTGEDRTPLQREIDFVGRTLGIAVIGSPSVRSPDAVHSYSACRYESAIAALRTCPGSGRVGGRLVRLRSRIRIVGSLY
jgi:hypothetical protein